MARPTEVGDFGTAGRSCTHPQRFGISVAAPEHAAVYKVVARDGLRDSIIELPGVIGGDPRYRAGPFRASTGRFHLVSLISSKWLSGKDSHLHHTD